MEKERKIECECGGQYSVQRVKKNGVETEAYVCDKCKETMLSRKQADKYVELLKMKDASKEERKIIRVGNSMGITLPDMLKKFGVKVGRKVRLEPIDRKSIKITLI